MRVFRPFAVALSLLLTACAAPQVRPPGAIRKVVVVVGSRVDTLPTSTYREDLMGEGNPRTVLVSQTEAVLRERGFEVVGSRISAAPAPSTDEVVRLIDDNKAEAAVVVVLGWIDASAIYSLGRADVVLDTGVVSPTGDLKWRNETHTVSQVSVFQAQADWNSYLRKAVIEAVRAVP
ncbi:hypothetical protein JY651_13155 [Pyxidicoccus parkwayensis]|uniref:Lipoprotein n=1 Tax=Pyxidicoccus parkwayensis TaxID=2813578 RepID=A0ABX7P5Z5_9BACT|nr:hypothetical protein [Pyxidicoccus parkwaysis]QSQ25812.1 hypothetical protein JY651_13155 [Pyxidicoccus parkwaysis]